MSYFTNDDQLRSFLKSEANRLQVSIPNTYNTYFSRVFLERISSNNKGLFLVKGSFSQYVHIGKLVRPITDVDIATPYKAKEVLNFMEEAIKNTNDELAYEITKVSEPSNNDVTSLNLIAKFGRTRHPIGMDIKQNYDRLYELAYKPVAKVFKGDEVYYVNTPSMEEHIAEKLCIISEMITRGDLITRMKDFYDIYELHGGEYDPEKLSIYYAKMLADRGIVSLENISTEHLNRDFTKEHQLIWEQMGRKYEFLEDISIEEAVFYTRAVLSEQLQKAKKGRTLSLVMPKKF